MLQLADVHTYYGDSHVLQGVTFDVPRGSVTAVLGRNGVGKTTMCRTVVGFTPARAGRVLFGGADITRMPSHRIHGMHLGLVPQGRRVFPSLTVHEHLAIASSTPSSISRVFALFPRLEERRHHRGNELSGGEQQMLAIGRALVASPVLVVMDEPTEGLSIASIAIVADADSPPERRGHDGPAGRAERRVCRPAGRSRPRDEPGAIVHSSDAGRAVGERGDQDAVSRRAVVPAPALRYALP